jgi:hypothetical protein
MSGLPSDPDELNAMIQDLGYEKDIPYGVYSPDRSSWITSRSTSTGPIATARPVALSATRKARGGGAS